MDGLIRTGRQRMGANWANWANWIDQTEDFRATFDPNPHRSSTNTDRPSLLQSSVDPQFKKVNLFALQP